MSPTMRAVPAMHPSQFAGRLWGEGGRTSATGSPKRVTRTGLRVLRTCSRMPRHLALNSEMAISFTLSPEQNLYHGQQPCSRIMDTVFPRHDSGRWTILSSAWGISLLPSPYGPVARSPSKDLDRRLVSQPDGTSARP